MEGSKLKGRRRQTFDFDWKFHKGDIRDGQEIELSHMTWRNIHLPHDYSIEGSYDEEHASGFKGGYLPIGIGWYRKSFTLPEEWVDREVFIEFDGIYMNSDVWINGYHLGHRPNGYIGFEYDLTPYLQEGDNLIAVRVDHEKGPTGRWYTGSGIYRHTWLTCKDKIHVDHWGTYISIPSITEEAATLNIENSIINVTGSREDMTVVSEVIDRNDIVVAVSESYVSIQDYKRVQQQVAVRKPMLWSPDNPYLYRVRTRIYQGAELKDDVLTTIGIRSFTFNSIEGFKLNNKPMKFKGVCLHHDGGSVGVAVPKKVLLRRLLLLKEMGCNAIRTGHTPFAPEFYELCDQLGLMVMDEIFDGWEQPKMPYDYGLYFKKWWKRDLADFIKRDRNHPSVIMWSIGNEVIGMTTETSKKLLEFIHAYDSRPVTNGIQQSNGRADDNREILDIAGYNGGGDGAFIFERDHERHPNRVCIATEVPHTFQTRGFYRTQTWWRDQGKKRVEIENLTKEEIFFDGALEYNSSYDNSGVRISARDSWKQTKSLPYLIGEFRWTGFDYLGESFGWPARSGNFGVLDLAGFKKDHFFLYQSQWTNSPMLHMLPHWTHLDKDGIIIPVWVYSNCDSVELFYNNDSLGEKTMTEDLYLQWNVPYRAGTLHAVGKREGEIVAEKKISTAGTQTRIVAHTDNKHLLSDSRDIAHVTFKVVDDKGVMVPHAHDRLTFKLIGPVNSLGYENGDPLDITAPHSNYRKVFNGMVLGIYQSTFTDGNIEVIVGGVLGEHLFGESTEINISVIHTMLRGVQPERSLKVYYTLDGTEPNEKSYEYTGKFTIHHTCQIRVSVYHENRLFFTFEDTFQKGEKPKVIDLVHGNSEKIKGRKGPLSKEVIGKWYCGEQRLTIQPNGKYLLSDNRGREEGAWWYDYPADPFEEPDYIGKGELEGNGGACTMHLLSHRCNELSVIKGKRSFKFQRS